MKKRAVFQFVLLVLICSLFSSCGGQAAKKEKAIKLVAELDKIETKIILGFENNLSKEDLLDLISQLEHPSSLYIEGKKYGIIEDKFRQPNESYFGHYNEYYTELRDAYRFIVMNNMTIQERITDLTKKDALKNEKEQITISQPAEINNEKAPIDPTELISNEKDIAEDVKSGALDQVKNFIGLYIKQNDDGSTFMYKLNKNNEQFEVVYQDNVTGNVRIENYDVFDYESKSRKLKIRSRKDATKTVITFRPRLNSPNTFDLLDENNILYEFMN